MLILVFVSQSLGLLDCSLSLFSLEYLSFSSKQSILAQLFSLIEELILRLDVDVHQGEGIFDEIELDFVVKWSICGETRCMINLQKYRLPFIIHHNV
jgi:hypothetical protein